MTADRSQQGPETRIYEQIHVDAARNATDDFNPFHDPGKWQRVQGNPFGGTIVLGFQLECLAEYLVTRRRVCLEGGDTPSTAFRTYQFLFAGALRPGEPLEATVKPTLAGRSDDGSPQWTSRVIFRKPGGLVLRGAVRDTDVALCPAAAAPPVAWTGEDLAALPDRCFLQDGAWFHKRKFMLNSNAKNLLAGSLADQHWYFDELEARVNFPDMMPAALISSALLEKAWARGFDFYANPMVYTSHHISVDQRIARALRSNDRVHLLVDQGEALAADKGLGRLDRAQQRHRCLGLVADGSLLFGGEVVMAPLASILG